MRRSAELECIDDEAELVVRLLGADTQHLEHTLLHIGIMDTDRTAAQLGAVEHKVVSIGANPLQIFLGVGIEPLFVLGLRSRKRMVHGIETAVLVAPLQQREIHNPQRGEHLRITQAKAVAHLDTEHAQTGLGLTLLAAHHQQQVARRRAASGSHFLKLLWRIELVHAGLDASVSIELDVHQAGGAHLRTLDPLGQLIQLLAGIFRASGDGDGAHVLR